MELEAAVSINAESDSKAVAVSRQCSSLELQLSEAQQAAQQDLELRTQLQTRLRDADSRVTELQDLIDEQHDQIQQQEMRITTQAGQVSVLVVLVVTASSDRRRYSNRR